MKAVVVRVRKADAILSVKMMITDFLFTVLAMWTRTECDSLFLERLWFSYESHYLLSVESRHSFLRLFTVRAGSVFSFCSSVSCLPPPSVFCYEYSELNADLLEHTWISSAAAYVSGMHG
jgi:hypothetical protein